MSESANQNDTGDADDDAARRTGVKDENRTKGEKLVGHGGKKKVSRKEKKWTREDEPLWRVFVNSYLEREEKLEKEDKFARRKAPFLPRFPTVKSSEQIPPSAAYPCFPLNTFNLEDRARLPDRRNRHEKIRLWRNMKNDPAVDTSSFLPEVPPEISRTNSDEWPGTWPCVERDLTGEFERLEKLRRRERKGLLPCQEDTDDESNPDVPRDDFAYRKELGHARVPITCQSAKKSRLVDRAAGERPGLVDGDYVVFVFDSDNDEGSRSYAGVCLRGLKGMHLAELNGGRAREKTWKFCFYQAIVALLAKTQLRYKYAWSANVDYIFDHAWMLFVHMGGINVKARIRLDDVVVYNYKYSVELELVHEIKDAPRIGGVGWSYVEDDLTSMVELERPELMKTKEEIGRARPKSRKPPPVHESTRKIEEWFDGLPDVYRNCVYRTSRFSLAFWKDGTFWYLFNPYRCDEFGLWCDEGYASITKFCTRYSLKRHLMILTLRAYSYEPRSNLKVASKIYGNANEDTEDKSGESEHRSQPMAGGAGRVVDEEGGGDEKSSISGGTEEDTRSDSFTIQIYRMIYHCARIENVKLLQRKPAGPRMERARKKDIDDCGSDPLASHDPCARDESSAELAEEDDRDVARMERPGWLERFKLTWTRFAAPAKGGPGSEEEADGKVRWHQFYVEEPRKVFTLWGEIHPTETIFPRENRGRQIYACYVACAGMTRIQAPEYWSSKTLDAIVMCGDRYYTLSRLESEAASRNPRCSAVDGSDGARRLDGQLGGHCKIGDTLFEAEILAAFRGTLYGRNGGCLWKAVEDVFLEHHFAILTCESSCLGIFKFCGAYYMMDAHSIGPPLFNYGAGVAYLVRATSFVKFMTVLVLTIGSGECSRFFLNPIEIGKVTDLGTTDVRAKGAKTGFRRTACPREDRAKGSKRSKGERKRTTDRVSCSKNGCGNRSL